jgi:hypothetical protein
VVGPARLRSATRRRSGLSLTADIRPPLLADGAHGQGANAGYRRLAGDTDGGPGDIGGMSCALRQIRRRRRSGGNPPPLRRSIAPMQSPAVMAGLRRIATSLWLRFVALPQRLPIFCYRRWDRPVVSLIYRVPPRRRVRQHRQFLVAANSWSTRSGVLHAIPDTARDVASHESRSASPITYSFRLR